MKNHPSMTGQERPIRKSHRDLAAGKKRVQIGELEKKRSLKKKKGESDRDYRAQASCLGQARGKKTFSALSESAARARNIGKDRSPEGKKELGLATKCSCFGMVVKKTRVPDRKNPWEYAGRAPHASTLKSRCIRKEERKAGRKVIRRLFVQSKKPFGPIRAHEVAMPRAGVSGRAMRAAFKKEKGSGKKDEQNTLISLLNKPRGRYRAGWRREMRVRELKIPITSR